MKGPIIDVTSPFGGKDPDGSSLLIFPKRQGKNGVCILMNKRGDDNVPFCGKKPSGSSVNRKSTSSQILISTVRQGKGQQKDTYAEKKKRKTRRNNHRKERNKVSQSSPSIQEPTTGIIKDLYFGQVVRVGEYFGGRGGGGKA